VHHGQAISVLLNLAEGQKFNNGNRRKHYEIAQGSANEVKAALDAAEAWGWIECATAQRQLLDRVLALLWRLTHADAIRAGSPRRTG
jgi:four helix bundle protein